MKHLLAFLVFFIIISSQAQAILSVKEQATVIDEILEERFDQLLPELMDLAEIDMWVVISREYNEDPVIKTMLPATWLNARRRTILLFFRDKKNNTIEKLAVARYNVGKQIISAWDKEKTPDQWERLITLIKERNPKKIGLNFSKDFMIIIFSISAKDKVSSTSSLSLKLSLFWIISKASPKSFKDF